MKPIYLMLTVIATSWISLSSAMELTCWDKRSPSKKPALTAEVVSATKLKNIVDDVGNKSADVVKGEKKSKSIKYKDHYYFSLRINTVTDLDLILPVGFSRENDYFDGVARYKSADGGSNVFLHCRVD